MKLTTLTLTALVAAAALGLGACGNATVPTPASAPPATTQPSVQPSETSQAPSQAPSPTDELPVSQTIKVGDHTMYVPDKMRFPEQISFKQVTTNPTGGLVLLIGDADEVFSFFRQELPKAGYLPYRDLSSGLLVSTGGGWVIQVTKTSDEGVMVSWGYQEDPSQEPTEEDQDEPVNEPTEAAPAPSETRSDDPTETQPTQSSSPVDDGTGKGAKLTVDGTVLTDAPIGLTFPKGTKISSADIAGANGRVYLDAPSGKELIRYFRTELPKAGFTVTAQGESYVSATGKGWTIAVTINGAHPAVAWAYEG